MNEKAIISAYLAKIASKGGKAGTGASKTRSREHYKLAGKASAELRRVGKIARCYVVPPPLPPL